MGLTAASATPTEQRVFQLTASDPAEAALRPADPGGMCILPRSNYTFSHTALSANWGGGMNINDTTDVNTYYSAELHWYQPHYEAVCPGASLNAIWSGLGGYNYHNGYQRLIQSGTDLSGSTLQGAHFWYEVIVHGAVDSYEVAVSSPTVSAGDYVGTKTSYSSSGNGTMIFRMMNFTTGQEESYGLTGWGGFPAYSFYDGSTADYISESTGGGSAPGGYYYLREPTSDISFPYAVANGHAIDDYKSWRINTTSSSGSGHYSGGYWYKQGSWFDGMHAWTDVWYSCS